MASSAHDFATRASRITVHGVGLSVDVFSPDLFELSRMLAVAGAEPDYLEIFKAPARELARIRATHPMMPLAYHAEGLWLIDPMMQSALPWRDTVRTIARHAETLGAQWVNHECAGKQFGGHSFGTYLPPLFTQAAAQAAGEHAVCAQDELDEWYRRQGRPDASPLLLLEVPPLTYFGFGDLPVAEFFARLVEWTSCGLVLDIGHLWTHWRYRERRRHARLEAFTDDFMKTFPVDRLIQIHLAGLGVAEGLDGPGALPYWIDRHDAPTPSVLFDLLRQVLAHPALTSLKGIALEVDTKDVPAIIEEWGRLREEPLCRRRFAALGEKAGTPLARSRQARGPFLTETETAKLADAYASYARVVSGAEALETSLLADLAGDVDREGLVRYTTVYLPHELLHWGGDLPELFPAIWKALEARGVTGEDFVRCWFGRPRPVADQYDFFYVKLDRWVEFIGDVAPDLLGQARCEADAFRALHAELNDEALEGHA